MYALPGRAGLDLNLTLYYNSHIWVPDSQGGMLLGFERDTAGPGFQLNFGFLEWNPSPNGPNGILSTADGAKHTLTTDISNLVPNAPPPNNTSYSCANQICLYNSTDSSYINVSRPLGTFSGAPCTGPNNCPAKDSTVTYKNGTTAIYQSFAVVTNDIFDEFVMRPYRITDSNGNFITISYTNTNDLSISSITDSVGRTLNFFYTSNGASCGGGGACAGGALLSCVTDGTSCTAPGAKTYTFSWDPSHVVNFNFTLPGQELIGGNLQSVNSGFTTPVLTKVCRPDGSCAKFSYGDFAIVNDIQELSANGTTVRYELNYDFPAASAGALSLNPTFTHQKEIVNGQTNTWTYSATTDANGLISSSSIIDPVGLVTTTTYSRKGDWQDGLPIQVQMQDANAFHTQQLCLPTPCPQPSLKTQNITWASDLSMAQTGITNGGTPTGNNPRAASITTVLDDNSQSQVRLQYDNSATPIAAGAPQPFTGSGSIIDKVETDFGAGAPGSVLRETVMSYKSLPNHILGLPTDIKVKDGSGKVVSHTAMAYDGAGVQSVSPLPGIGHDNIGYSAASSAPRGNLTSSTVYPDPASTTGITSTYIYDMLGNRIAQAGCCNTTAWNYSSTTQFAYPDSVVVGSTGSQLTTSYTYNLNNGQMASSTDWNGKVTNFLYDISGRLTSSQGPDGVTNSTKYDDNSANPAVSTSSTANSLVTTHTGDFRGHTLSDQILNTTTVISTVTQVNDATGKPVQQSNPFAPSETPLYTSYAYDVLGRATQTIPPAVISGGIQIPYSSSITGPVTVSTDPANHQSKQYANALGQIVRVDRPGPTGGVVASVATSVSGTEQSVPSNSASNGATAGIANISISPTAPCSSSMQDRCVTLLTHPATPAGVTVTIGGSNTTNSRSSTACTGGPPSRLPLRCHTTSSTFTDSGTITFSANAGGITVGPVSVNYDSSSTQTGLAGALAAALPANGALAVSYGGGTSFTLTTKAAGTATNGSTIATSLATGCVPSSFDDGSGNSSSTNCAGPGWTITPGQTFAGGSDNGFTTYNDTGNVTVTFVVPGIAPSPTIQVSETVPYGQNDSSSTLVQALATKFSTDPNATQFVTASASGGQLTLVTTATGSGTNYSISATSATNSPKFVTGSTSFQASGPAVFSPGQPGTLFDAGTVTATLNGFGTGTPPTETVNYSQGSTAAALAASLAAKINADSKWQGAVTASVANGSSNITFAAASQGAFANQYSVNIAGTSKFPSSFAASSFANPAQTAQLVNGADPAFSIATPITTTYSYDPYDRVLQINSGQQTQTYVYDGLGRMTSATTPESAGLPVKYTYKDFGAIATKTDPRTVPGTSNPVTTTYTYDGLNRVTNISYNDNVTPAVTYVYNPPNSANNTGGRLASVSNGGETKAYQYDVLGRVTQCLETIGANTYTVSYNYGADGQLTSITYPSQLKVSYAYDPIGRLKQLGTATQNILSINPTDYNAAGSPLTVTYGNGVTGKFGYNSQLQRSSIQYAGPSPATPLLSLTYLYGGNADNGQIQQVTDSVTPARSTSYQYDPLGRLQTAQTVDQTSANTWKLSYSYDNYGNRLNQTPTGGTGAMPASSTPVDPATNRILGSGVIYDAVGNMISDGLNNYVFDANSNLTSTSGVPAFGGSPETFGYGPDGKLVNKNGTYLIYANGRPIAEYANGAAATSPTAEYVNLGGQQLARIIGGAVTFNYADHLSTRVTADLSGTPVRTYGHFPYGETAYETGAASDFKFTSYRRDANTGLDYADVRFYSSRLGRFTSMDALLGDNRYAYVSNDPINLVDPSGMEASCTTNPFELSTRPLCGPDQLGGGGGGGGASCGINFDDGGFTVSFASGCSSFSVDFSGGMGGPFGNIQNTLQNLLAIILPIDTCPAGGFECPEDGSPLFGTPSCSPWCALDVQDNTPFHQCITTKFGKTCADGVAPWPFAECSASKGDKPVESFNCIGASKNDCLGLFDGFANQTKYDASSYYTEYQGVSAMGGVQGTVCRRATPLPPAPPKPTPPPKKKKK